VKLQGKARRALHPLENRNITPFLVPLGSYYIFLPSIVDRYSSGCRGSRKIRESEDLPIARPITWRRWQIPKLIMP